MQKVSKKTLLIIFLSIVLILSTAMSFTFAKLQDSAKVTGTIKFDANIAVTVTGNDLTGVTFSGSNREYKLDFTAAAFVYDTASEAFKLKNANELKQIKIKITNNAPDIVGYYKVTLTPKTISGMTLAKGTQTTSSNTFKGTVAQNGGVINLTVFDIVSNITLTEKIATKTDAFVINVDAQYAAFA